MSIVNPNGSQIAVQSLQAIQAQLGAIADNVANTENPNYSRQDVSFQATATGGVIVDVTSAANDGQALRAQLLNDTSAVANASALQSFQQQLAQALGNTGLQPQLTGDLNGLAAAAIQFQSNPSSAANGAFVQAANQFASDVRGQFANLQQLQASTTQTLQQAVQSFNSSLTQLNRVNQQIQAAGPQPALLDQQNQVLQTIAKFVPITATTQADGTATVYTQSGTPLVASTVTQLAYDPNTETLYNAAAAPPIAFGGQGSLNQNFQGGSLGALVNILAPTTNAADPNTGAIAKASAQLASLVDNVANTSTYTNANPAALENAYAAAGSALPTDLPGGAAPAQGVFTTNIVPGQPDEASLAVNPALLNGTATIKSPAAGAIVAALTSTTYSLGSPAPVGGLSLTGQSLSGLASGIANFQAQNQSQAGAAGAQAQIRGDQAQLDNTARNGVELDAQLVNLQQASNLYKASAKLLSVQDETFQTLLNIG